MIEVDHLTREFGGRAAVKDISFRVAPGECLGFLGPNGAGKTTTMRVLTCYLPPTSGTARVAGFDVISESMEVRRRIGYLPENPPLYDEMTVRDYLLFAARLRGIVGRSLTSRIDAAAERCGLTSVLPRVIGHLSRGYRQRVGLAQAIVHDPPVLILDEPTVGLDPAQIVEIRGLIKSLAGEQTVIFSTHILPEVAALCSSVVIINEGEARVAGLLSELTAGGERRSRIHLRVARDTAQVAGELGAFEGVGSIRADGRRPGGYVLEVTPSDSLRERVAGHVVERGWGLLEITSVEPTLEEIYLSVTAGPAVGEVS